MSFKVQERYRNREYSDPTDGNNGLFRIPPARGNRDWLTVIASDGGGYYLAALVNAGSS